ncbi:MAG: TIGR02300 family protein [Shimia sp.]
MPKEEWGVKRVCPTTGKRFYDLGRDPVVSPYTGEVVTLTTGKTRSMVADAEDAQTKKLKADAEETEEAVVLDDDDAEEESSDVDLGDDVLEEDDEEDNVSLDDLADVAAEGDDDD